MYKKLSMYRILFFSLLLTGCANSIYFYETEKISLTVEARPDSTQPVQGNLGLKQRVALIVPQKSNNVEKDGEVLSTDSNNVEKDGEALSTISSFDFRIKDDKDFFRFNPVLIKTAFITGEAASNLYTENKAATVAKILSSNGQALEAIKIDGEMIHKISNHVANGSDSVDTEKLDNLISRAEKSDPNRITASVKEKIRKTTKRSELETLLFDPLDGAIHPLYKAIPTN
ncbi:MAG: hypothetical protein DU480_11375 [Nitrosomonas sp.]|uniref:hypothetical protein n=1 Tax=Nitrosomonas sp. TaxID=42353 RepID=UPI0032ED635D